MLLLRYIDLRVSLSVTGKNFPTQKITSSHDDAQLVRMGPPVGVGIGSLPMTPNKNGEIGVLCVESDLAGTGRHNKK